MFTGSRSDPDEWAEIFHDAGACFAGPVAEHHDGFAMWNTKYSDWNAAKMGPKRDVVGELLKVIKGHGIKFSQRISSWRPLVLLSTWDKRYDVGDPRYSGLYDEIRDPQALPDTKFLDVWKGKLTEVVDNYDPDVVWFDFGLELIQQWYKKQFAAFTSTERRREGKMSRSPTSGTI